ncbi:hypothetical protein BKA61DRAFT_734364 [Leptodontidium sp. MPI-SDFR-AT-0119]|nr:hypothetical protein BKA61DRAFT_734364 [Leptodontidium sp. MPI-SDFR-AT-0119]
MAFQFGLSTLSQGGYRRYTSGYVSPYAPAPAVAPQARPSSRAQSNASYVPPTPSIDNTIVTQDSFSRGMLPLQQPGESNNTPQRVSSDPDPKFDLESFTLFPKLPLELRGMIWKRSFIGRQVILKITSSQVIGGGRVIFQSKGNPPAYKIMLRDLRNQNSVVYVHLELDTVVFQYSPSWLPNDLEVYSEHMKTILNRLTIVEMHRGWWEKVFFATTGGVPLGSHFRGLRELTLVLDDMPWYFTRVLPSRLDSVDEPLEIKTSVGDKLRQYFKNVPGYEVPVIAFRCLE